MDRLVGDDAFEDCRRRVPVDPPQFQEAPVEPAAQQGQEVRVQRFQVAIVPQGAQQVGPHPDQPRRRPRHHVQPRDQPPAGRFGRPMQPPERGRVARRPVADRPFQGFDIGAIALLHAAEQIGPVGFGQPVIAVQRLAGRDKGQRLAGRVEHAVETGDRVAAVTTALAPPAGPRDAVEDLVQEMAVGHGAAFGPVTGRTWS